MNCLEKRHMSHKAGMQHLGYLDNFMDETDREVMSLTDRAFKSLCIGDEAIYNDSPSPVSCRKPLAEEVPKKTQGNCSLTVKKNGTHPLNGVIDSSWQFNKDTSLFAAFATMKNGDAAKIMNGDSWDKSALLSIQRELSEFSSDYHNNLADKHGPQVKNHLKPSEKSNKPSKDPSTQSGKQSKSKHSKSSKLRKLNSKNFFLHSEFSPFQSWRDLNKFPFELNNIEIFQSNRPPEWYDCPLYKKLTMSHRLQAPESNKGAQCHNPSPPILPEANISPQVAQTLKSVPLKVESYTELSQPKLHLDTPPQVLRKYSSSEQRCQSEGDPSAPWRKNRSRAKSAVPVGQSTLSSLACERTKTSEESVLPNKKEVRTMEELASTPFSILQLLTPVIPSRQGTGSSEILRCVLSPSTLDLPPLPETEMHQSPEIKREGYKSKASQLLFNLKDNRKRVKAMYSPPKFKGIDVADQNKLSPLIEQFIAKNDLEVPEIPDAKVKSPVHCKPHVSPVTALAETADQQNSPPSRDISGGLPDDYLALCLLQDGNSSSPHKPLRSNKSPAVSKVTYPSLNLYRKANPVDPETNAMLAAPISHLTADKNTAKGQNMSHTLGMDDKVLQRNPSAIHVTKQCDAASGDGTHLNYTKTKRTAGAEETESTMKDKYPFSVIKNHPRSDTLMLPGSRNEDKQNLRETGKTEQSPVKDLECLRKESKPKHLFSARQNNYIKNQRYVNVDEHEEYGEEEVVSAGKNDENDGVLSRASGGSYVREGRKGEQYVGVHKAKEVVERKQDGLSVGEVVKNDALSIKNYADVSGTCSEQSATKNDSLSMKGNTSAKRAMFAAREHRLSKEAAAPKKEDALMDKFELAKLALEEVIAEREQRKRQSHRFLSASRDDGKDSKRVGGTDLVRQEDSKQVDRLASSQNDTLESVTKSRRGGHFGTSDFKPRSQIVQSMSERDTKHGEGHVAEVNLVTPCKQEGAAKCSLHAAGEIKYTKRVRPGRHQQGETVKVKPLDKVTELKVPVPKKESSRVTNADGKLAKPSEELEIQQKSTSYKPEVPPRRGRTNSQSEVRYDPERREEVEGRADKLSKNEEMITKDGKTVNPNQTKERGPIRGHVSALKEKFDKEQQAQSINIQEFSTPVDDAKKDKIKEEEVPVSNPSFETVATNYGHNGAGMITDEEFDKDSKNIQDIKTIVNDIPPDSVGKNERECAFEDLRANDHKKPEDHHKGSNIKELLRGLEKVKEVKDSETVEPHSPEKEITRKMLETSESFRTGPIKDSIIVYDILKQSEPPSSVDFKQEQGILPSDSSKESSTLPQTQGPLSPMSSQTRKHEENLVQASEPCASERIVSPPGDLDNGGWVRCLIESARNLTPTSQSNASSPTMGKPALFKVKDNTFSSSPITKTVRPIFHKSVSDFSQPWSPRESLSGSERGEQDLFKDSVEMQSPVILSPTPPSTPARSPQPNQSSLHLLSPPASHFTTSREKKSQLDSLSVPEEDEMQSAVSSVSEGIESCGISGGDTAEEGVCIGTLQEDAEGSKAPSERSGSACSGAESQSQSKPPVVPPKTEKGLRRAMKLTTRRIQKAEAKSKLERKGRSSEKSTSHKPERRSHSSDGRSDHRVNQECAEEKQDEKSFRKSHQREKAKQEKVTDSSRNLQHENHGTQICNQDEAKHSISEDKLEHEGQPDVRNLDVHCERLGRTSVKYLPNKLDRRAHSLDRFVSDKSDLSSVSRMSSEISKRPIVRQRSIEHAYASPAASIVTQSFPMTQRKLLQDPDSGQYFVVDMPVQVKTKTFFDPETGSYVQLPVQSPEAQSMEVVNAPPLVLYHGFVPVPIPTQKSAFKVGPVIGPDDSGMLESGEKCKAVGQPYNKPAHVSQEHLAEEDAR